METLQCYFGQGDHRTHADKEGRPFSFSGARFDTWDSTGSRSADVDRFTADDVVAVSMLAVDVPGDAAIRLLDTESDEFTSLLKELGPDRDLVTEAEPWNHDWVGLRLFRKLDALPGVGATRASKLLARKRPSLRPVYDSKVEKVIGMKNLWEPLRQELQIDTSLHGRLIALRGAAGVSEAVSAIRVFDVLAWMQGSRKGCTAVHERAGAV